MCKQKQLHELEMFLIPEGVATLLAPMMPLQKPAQNYNNHTQITKPKKSLRSHTLIFFNAKQQKRKVSQNLLLIGICSKNTFKLQKLKKKNIYGHSMQVCHLYKNKHRHSVTNKRGPYELFRLKNCTKSSNLISMFSLTLLATPHSRCYATHAFFFGEFGGMPHLSLHIISKNKHLPSLPNRLTRETQSLHSDYSTVSIRSNYWTYESYDIIMLFSALHCLLTNNSHSKAIRFPLNIVGSKSDRDSKSGFVEENLVS